MAGSVHPMDGSRILRIAVVVAVSCIVLALVAFWALADVTLMEVTNDPEVFLGELDDLGWQPVQWALIADLFFPILYVLISLLAVRFAHEKVYQSERLVRIGPWMEVVAVIAGVCDLFENVFLLIAIGNGPVPPETVAVTPLYLSSLFSYLKWLGLAAVVAYAAPALVVALRTYRRPEPTADSPLL